MTDVKVGSIWRENDPRFTRYARIVAMGDDKAEIAVCNPDTGWTSARRTKAKVSRFGKAYRQITQ